MTIASQPAIRTRRPVSTDYQLERLRSRLVGQIITAASTNFDAARKTLYINVDRRPLAVVRAANAQDIAETVRFARDRALPLAVRRGGHRLALYRVNHDARTEEHTLELQPPQ